MMFTVLAGVFICFAWSRAILRYRDGIINLKELFLWSAIWFAAVVLLIQPGISFTIASKLGIMRGADVAIYTSIGLLYYLIFRLYIKVSTVDHEITRLIRALALNQKDKTP